MLNPAHLARPWQQESEVASPPRWIFAITIAARPGRIEHRLDPPAQSIRGLRFFGPYRCEHLHHECSIDCPDRKIPNYRIRVGLERVPPLPPGYGVSPPGFLVL